MTEKQARRLGIGDGVYEIVRCLQGVVSYFTFTTVTITWENGRGEVIEYGKMQDIERKQIH